MLFLTSIIFVSLKYFGVLHSSWEVIILFLSAFAAIAFSISMEVDKVFHIFPFGKVNQLDEKVRDIKVRLEFVENHLFNTEDWEEED